MWSVVIFMILVLAAMMAGCRDLLSSKVLKSNDHPKQDVNKKFYIPPMVIVVGLLCFIMYASEGAVMGWSVIFVSQERGIDMSVAGFFYTAFAIAMTVSSVAWMPSAGGTERRQWASGWTIRTFAGCSTSAHAHCRRFGTTGRWLTRR